MTARKATKKKAKHWLFTVREKHDGNVSLSFEACQLTDDRDGKLGWSMSRDDALLLAIELMVSSSVMSRAEVAKHFSK